MGERLSTFERMFLREGRREWGGRRVCECGGGGGVGREREREREISTTW